MFRKFSLFFDREETPGRFFLDVLTNSGVIIILFLLIQKFIAAPFQVIGHSMDTTLHDREYIVVSKLEYIFGEAGRGDIIVFHPPQGKKDYYIKRIIGVPGDTVHIKSGKVFVNGKELEEPYLKSGLKTCMVAFLQDCVNDDKSYVVPQKEYFVLGDNRTGSSDSRAWFDAENKPDPFVDEGQIQGKTRVVAYPLTAIRLVEGSP